MAPHPPPDVSADAADAEAIVRSRRDPAAFTEIFHRHFAAIHGYAARRLGVDAADDIAAETFLAAFRKRGRFDPARGSVRPWLYGIATRLIGLHRRAEGRRFRALARTPADHFEDGHEDLVTARVTAGGAGAELADALAKLPRGDRDVLLLVALADLSYEEVGQALGLKTGTVASRLHRARRRLRESLGGTHRALMVEESPA
ncbi:RNA polymerase sigma factor [Actinomadura madurae]|uniref:RNA polymerase sigma factor n=1 Tax=Actinomadura madurae TaxID=1993 RepID=UPI002025FCF1|nr:RNA polymerase sigma factor [Actinomadura madurae]MCP9968443.1 RNA polymerase sigma factor [Actinomadura madurae]URM97265.1 RNA polymerase sigma factor [Actinomadura madurae]URN08027.1 RNA polymerase sigma factor [Actinomadura madurae]